MISDQNRPFRQTTKASRCFFRISKMASCLRGRSFWSCFKLPKGATTVLWKRTSELQQLSRRLPTGCTSPSHAPAPAAVSRPDSVAQRLQHPRQECSRFRTEGRLIRALPRYRAYVWSSRNKTLGRLFARNPTNARKNRMPDVDESLWPFLSPNYRSKVSSAASSRR